MRLMKAICGHRVCDACLAVSFAKQLVLLCPVCKAQLRKANFTDQRGAGAAMDREAAVRRKIEREWNQREEDFESLDAYNDFLERREDIVYNLINGIDVEETQAIVAAYRAENARLIERNAAKREAEEQLMREKIRVEEERWILRRTQFLRQDQRERLVKLRAEADFLAGLTAGDDVVKLEARLRERRDNARVEAAALVEEEAAQAERQREEEAEAQRERERAKREAEATVLKLREEQRMGKRVIGASIRQAPLGYDAAAVLGDSSAAVRVKGESDTGTTAAKTEGADRDGASDMALDVKEEPLADDPEAIKRRQAEIYELRVRAGGLLRSDDDERWRRETMLAQRLAELNIELLDDQSE